MKSIGIVALAASVVLIGFMSCDKRPAAKFRPGDTVRVKATQQTGTVCLRTRFSHEDRYFVTLPESTAVFMPVRDREQTAAWEAEFRAKFGSLPWDPPRTSHEEGPFFESDLELVR